MCINYYFTNAFIAMSSSRLIAISLAVFAGHHHEACFLNTCFSECDMMMMIGKHGNKTFVINSAVSFS